MDELAQKILQNISLAFAKDPLIDEYDFLPIVEAVNNTNPVRCEEHKLGIDAWAVHSVFLYCYNNLLSWQHTYKPRTARSSELEKVVVWSKMVVMVVADCMTAWNIRKSLVDGGQITVDDELKFSQLVLTKHPKSPETFSHRKWLLSKLLPRVKCHKNHKSSNHSARHNSTINPATSIFPKGHSSEPNNSQHYLTLCDANSPAASSCGAVTTSCQSFPSVSKPTNSDPGRPGLHDGCSTNPDAGCEGGGCSGEHSLRDGCEGGGCSGDHSEKQLELLSQELDVCHCMALKYANNYHAWTHRIWIFQHGLDKKMCDRELEKTQEFVMCHVSDHSGYHYRQVVLARLGQMFGVVQNKDLLHSELELCSDIITTYPGHEAAWYHRRTIVLRLAQLYDAPGSPKMSNPGSAPKKHKRALCLIQDVPSLLHAEKLFCDTAAEQSQLGGAQGQWQVTLAHRHIDTIHRLLPSGLMPQTT